MKKLNSLNLGKGLNRTEMKNINGGIDAPVKCVSDCTDDAECRKGHPNSYCAEFPCNESGNLWVKKKSCNFY